MSDKTRLLELDVFRGIAAFYVVCFHYASYYGDHLNLGAPTLSGLITGIYGIQLFFMISGFVIFMTLEKTKKPMDFIVSRFSRLFPGYWAAVLLAFALIRIADFTGQEVSLRRAIANLSMIQNWVGVENIDGVYWTLSIELAFYFAMFILFVTKKLKYIEILGLGWLILMVLYAKIGFHAPRFMDIDNLLRYGNLFFAGVIFYNLKTKGETWYRHACLGLCLLVQYMVKIGIHHHNFLDPALGTFVVFMFFISFYFFITGKLSFIAIKPLAFLGTISYSLYLIHASISGPVMEYLYARHASTYLVFITPLFCSLLVATVITFGIEKPAMNYMRSAYKKWRLVMDNKNAEK